MTPLTLPQWLAGQSPALAATLGTIAQACARIADSVSLGALAGPSGGTDDNHEVPKKLDLFADERLAEALAGCRHVAAWASKAHDDVSTSDWHGESGEYLAVFAPLDGSPNIESNIPVGTVFSILPHPFRGTTPGAAGFLQPGRRQVAAGYVAYGPATVLMLSCGKGVSAFTLDRRDGQWRLTRRAVQLAPRTREFAIDASNQRYWEKPVQRYVAECLAGEDGPRASDFNMRWVASPIAEVHRILSRGGVFLSPRDTKEPRKPGRLRLLYEAAPMAFLTEQAGGAAVTGSQSLLDMVPDTLHQTAPVILGSRDEVELIVRYHADPSENVSLQLFKARSLFVQPQA